MTTKTRKTNRNQKKEQELFHNLHVLEKGRRRALNDGEREQIIAMLAIRECPEALSVDSLIPKGSYLEHISSYFKKTDVSYVLPLIQLIMIASSYLTQGGATLWIPGLGCQRPILWTMALAPSASSKTLATDKVAEILLPKGKNDFVRMLPKAGSDAQWIIEVKENNGGYWYQDEAGKMFHMILTQSNFARMKPWMLDAYSNKPISNRLKGEAVKLEIQDPHFTFLGLSVRETWTDDVDAASMLDGFCQRFNYVIAEPRSDTDMFDHFLYFAGEEFESRKNELREVWYALCAQKGALETYKLNDEVLPYLENWWRSLRSNWGDGVLPGSFIRRTGFSVLSYLVVLQFLLGKSNRKIDLETAELATKYAEYHLECTLIMMREYGSEGRSQIEKIARVRESLLSNGLAQVTVRDVQRRLSKKQSKELTRDRIAQILSALDRVETSPALFDEVFSVAGSQQDVRQRKAEFLAKQYDAIRERDRTQEGWRNKKRLQRLLMAYRNQEDSSHRAGDACNVVSLPECSGGARRKAC
ncbi:DUF3987 domain-containing protein [Maliponia aquimaris]|uniref:DUF3987 domain-containing protein n=1 Tax=Maliponia aquimaris TaxID=1673631 RepID=A0A238L4G8_9RHOB|nr:DUF3987 domain-containing protein [Maliponia aquimaris]SMX49919.1 hypothetical protein MAA8898_04505 [Maliponia aquimaris]